MINKSNLIIYVYVYIDIDKIIIFNIIFIQCPLPLKSSILLFAPKKVTIASNKFTGNKALARITTFPILIKIN
jgi:hypothetical protein